MQDLSDFSKFIREQHLRDLAIENLEIKGSMNIPLGGQPNDPEKAGLIDAEIQKLDSFLISLAQGTLLTNYEEILLHWKEENETGIHNEQAYWNLIFAYSPQKQALLKFVPLFVSDSYMAVEIVRQLEDQYNKIQAATFTTLFQTEEERNSKIKQSEQLLEQAQAIAHIGSWEFLIHENKTNWSTELFSIYDISKDEVDDTLESVAKYIHSEDKEYVLKTINEAIATGNPYNIYYRIERKDGSIRYIHSNATVIFALGKPVKLVGTAQDITDQVIKEKKFQTLLEAAPDVIILMNDLGDIIEWNKKAEIIFGWKKEEVYGKKLSNTIIPERYREAHERGMAHFLKTGVGPVLNKQLEIAALKKDGNEFPIELTISFVSTGASFIFIGFIRDISRRIEAESALRRLASIIENSDDAIYSKTLDDKLISWNHGAEVMYGYTLEEIINQPATILIPDDDLENSKEIARSVKEGEHINHFETTRIRKNGSIIAVSLSINPLRDHGGNIIGISTIARDITERKKNERHLLLALNKLEKKNKELNDFAYIVSHDLKAPLRAIGSLTNWLQSDYGAKFDEEGRQYIDLLIGRVTRMDNLIDGILHYSRIGRVKENDEEVNMNTLVREVIEMLAVPLGITILIENTLPNLIIAKTSMIQVFQNLISNAVKYMDKPDGIIKIGCKVHSNNSTFYVNDNGSGIEKKYFEKIFQIFQSLKARDEKESTGIGLAIVKKIIESYNGTIWVESEPGKGSTFFFTIPHNKEPDLANMQFLTD